MRQAQPTFSCLTLLSNHPLSGFASFISFSVILRLYIVSSLLVNRWLWRSLLSPSIIYPLPLSHQLPSRFLLGPRISLISCCVMRWDFPSIRMILVSLDLLSSIFPFCDAHDALVSFSYFMNILDVVEVSFKHEDGDDGSFIALDIISSHFPYRSHHCRSTSY